MPSKRARVAQALRDGIAAGDYQPGGMLPSENVLAREFDVSRETIRVALAALANEGLIVTEQGRGASVRDRSPLVRVASQRLARHTREANQGTHLAEAAQSGQPADVTTHVRVEFASAEVAAALELPTGAEVLVRDRTLRLGGQPTQLAVSHYPRTLTRDTAIEQADTGPGGVLSRLEDAGHTIASHTERVTLHRATATESTALQVPVGSACLRIRRTTRSDTGRILEVVTMTLVDRYELLYEIPAE